MSWQYIPLRPIPDQEFSVTVNVNDENIPIILHLRFNTEGEFWHMDIIHLGIGSVLVLKNTEETAADIPGLDDLGTDFLLIWGSMDE